MDVSRQFTAVVHGVFAAASGLAWWRARSRGEQGAAGWLVLCCVMVLLGLDRTTLFSSDIEDRVRNVARNGDWYENRRNLQIGLSVIGGVLVVSTAGALVRFRSLLRPTQSLALFAAAGLAALRLVRVVSLHDVDVVLRTEFVGVRVSTLADGVLLVVVAGALATSLRPAD